jgi:hypothetical protein
MQDKCKSGSPHGPIAYLNTRVFTPRITAIFAGLVFSTPALAYIGPGAGLSAIGSVLALLGAVLLMILGFVWYPVKRILARRKQDAPPPPPQVDENCIEVEGAPQASDVDINQSGQN